MRRSSLPPKSGNQPEQLPKLHSKIQLADIDHTHSRDIAHTKLRKHARGLVIASMQGDYVLYDKGNKEGRLGSGGFGEVWLAQNTKTGDWIAVKKVTRGNEAELMTQLMTEEIRFLQEINSHLHNSFTGLAITKKVKSLAKKVKSIIKKPDSLSEQISEIENLKDVIDEARGHLPEQLERLLQALAMLNKQLITVNETLTKKFGNKHLQDAVLNDLLHAHTQNRKALSTQIRYLRYYAVEIQNLHNLDQYIFHCEQAEGSFIGMNLYHGTSLDRFIDAMNDQGENHKVSFRQQLRIAKNITKAVANLHKAKARIVDPEGHAHTKELLHRDLKPENTIIDHDGRIKLADLGLAKAVDNAEEGVSEDRLVGTCYYMAPELNDNPHSILYNEKSEVWSLHLMLAELFRAVKYEYDATGKLIKIRLLDKAQDYSEIFQRGIDVNVLELLTRMKDPDPDARPTINEIYSELDQINKSWTQDNLIDLDLFKVYTVRLSDVVSLSRAGKLNEFAYILTAKIHDARSIAFVRDIKGSYQYEIVAAERAFRAAGIAHFAPELFDGIHNQDCTQYVSDTYGVEFGTAQCTIESSATIAKEIKEHFGIDDFVPAKSFREAASEALQNAKEKHHPAHFARMHSRHRARQNQHGNDPTAEPAVITGTKKT